MVLGPFVEVFVILGLLSGGTIVNRDTSTSFSSTASSRWSSPRPASPAPRGRKSSESGPAPSSWQWEQPNAVALGAFDERLDPAALDDPTRRRRMLRFWRWRRIVTTPNTEVFKDRLLSRLLRKFPFLVEAWYWALIYWVYQLGRAFSAVWIIDESVVDAARRHALQLIHLEQRLHIFVEVPIQQYFIQMPGMMHWINRIYSFIHIPGTILFLVVLYYVTTTRPMRRLQAAQSAGNMSPTSGGSGADWHSAAGSFHPDLYEKRRRTMAMCNLVAFIIFTTWPCMPPRLLSDPNLVGDDAEALSFGFVDSVHSATGESSVWTTNKFCNQYAAMPSLHFGYSFLIGLTIATIPLESARGRFSTKRLILVFSAMIYPATILVAIIATANHFVLDAVAGAIVCAVVWHVNDFLLNLLPLEDYFLWAVRIHKPAKTLGHDYYKLSSRM